MKTGGKNTQKHIHIYAVLANVYIPVSNYYHPRMHCISTDGFSHAAVVPAWAYAVYSAKCAYLGLGTYGYPHLMFGTSILGFIVGKVVVVNGYCQVFHKTGTCMFSPVSGNRSLCEGWRPAL